MDFWRRVASCCHDNYSRVGFIIIMQTLESFKMLSDVTDAGTAEKMLYRDVKVISVIIINDSEYFP